MKAYIQMIVSGLAVICCMGLMGCPVSSKYPLGASGQVKINPDIVGTWINADPDVEASKVTVRREDDYTYSVTVDEKGETYMAETTTFKGWLTNLEGQTFLVLQEKDKGELANTYYVYHIQPGKQAMVTHDITLKINGTDAITSIPAYREEVSGSMKKEDFLAGEIKWTRQ